MNADKVTQSPSNALPVTDNAMPSADNASLATDSVKLHVDKLSFTYPQGIIALNDISFTLKAGEACAVAGAINSGKSTLLQIMAGFMPRLIKGTRTGSVSINNIDPAFADPYHRLQAAGLVFSSPDSQMSGFCPTVEQEIAWGLGNLGISREEMRQRTNNIIQLLGLERIRKSNPLTLSSGQKQRVALASMLALEPKAVLLDEPVSALDPQGRRDVLNYALALAKLGHMVLWATPSLEEASFFPRWLVLDEGRLIYDGAPCMDKAVKALPAPWCRVLQCGQAKGLWDKQSALTEKETAGFLKEMLGKKDDDASPASDIRSTYDSIPAGPASGTCAASGNAAIIAEDVSFAYSHSEGSELALHSISLSIAKGSVTAIIGSNGAGKTTLARLLNGTFTPCRGRVLLSGSDGKNWLNTAEISASRAAAFVGLIPRDPLKQIFAPTVYDEAAFGPVNLGFSKEKTTLAVKEALEAAALSDKASLHPYELNTAELKRLAAASILAMQTPVVIIDEPTSSLDANEANLLEHILQKLKERQATIIIITHDLDFAAEHCDSVIMLDKGRLISQAPPSRIFSRDFASATPAKASAAAAISVAPAANATPANASATPANVSEPPNCQPAPVSLPCAARLAQSLELPAHITSTSALLGWYEDKAKKPQ